MNYSQWAYLKIQFKLGARNLIRYKSRTLLSILMILGGFVAMVMFRGFASKLLLDVKQVAVDLDFGHIQIANDIYWSGKTDVPATDRYLSDGENLLQAIVSHPDVKNAGPRIQFFSLLNNNNSSLSARAVAFSPDLEPSVANGLLIVEGENFSNIQPGEKRPFEVLIGKGLKTAFPVKPGDDITLVTQTVDGALNAIDVTMRGWASAGILEIDNSTFWIPMEAAQTLLATSSFEKIVIRLKDGERFKSIGEKVLNDVNKDGQLKLKTWRDLATLFNQVDEFYRVQNGIIEMILLVIVFLGISNIVGISVAERTGEIGTMRALGNTRKEIIQLFSIECVILSLVSIVISIPISLVLVSLLESAKIMLVIPGASSTIAVRFALSYMDMIRASLFLIVVTVGSGLVPALKASRLQVVDALKHNR